MECPSIGGMGAREGISNPARYVCVGSRRPSVPAGSRHAVPSPEEAGGSTFHFSALSVPREDFFVVPVAAFSF